ncbi:hypothetical protein PtA15_3A87 [Puccinia triticina]|uniref:Uncharacterized protein n=1 Tax=Puccinia triticina TaxID=208348 RepID=A0ABY7CEC6_9BASI|nr:uncharacterized protein PtA15_3A87 [Puccinia triticina]WAQ82723.1 hypothetical protein PtA15_3A87 [Puccinia triticina]
MSHEAGLDGEQSGRRAHQQWPLRTERHIPCVPNRAASHTYARPSSPHRCPSAILLQSKDFRRSLSARDGTSVVLPVCFFTRSSDGQERTTIGARMSEALVGGDGAWRGGNAAAGQWFGNAFMAGPPAPFACCTVMLHILLVLLRSNLHSRTVPCLKTSIVSDSQECKRAWVWESDR